MQNNFFLSIMTHWSWRNDFNNSGMGLSEERLNAACDSRHSDNILGKLSFFLNPEWTLIFAFFPLAVQNQYDSYVRPWRLSKRRWESATTRQHGAWSEQTYLLKSELRGTGNKKNVWHNDAQQRLCYCATFSQTFGKQKRHPTSHLQPHWAWSIVSSCDFPPCSTPQRSARLPSLPTSSGTSADRRGSQMSRP